MNRKPLALAVAFTVFPALASAQGVLEEVVVTAQKKEETLTEAPVAVSVVSVDQMNDVAVFQGDDLNKLFTGIEVRFEGDSNVGVGIRGVGTFQQQSAPARVGVYLDDYYMASQAAFALGSMFDMANVQLLKGPQGTLYGQPSPTGAMILATADPNFDGVNGHVRATYQADPMGYNLQGAVNIPLLDNQLALRIAGLTDDRETGTENINPVNALDEERNRDGIRSKLLWEPTDTLSVKLGYTYMQSENSEAYRVVESISADAAFDVEADDRAAVADSTREIVERDEHFLTGHLNWVIGDVEVKWFAGALDTTQEIEVDRDNTDVPATILFQETAYGDDFESLQTELRVSGSALDMWDWTVGGYYQDVSSVTAVDTFAQVGSTGVFNIIIDIPLDTEIQAFFTHNEFHFTEDTTLTVGVRYNDFDFSDGTVLTGDFGIGSMLLPGGEITDPAVTIEDTFPAINNVPTCDSFGVSVNGDGVPPCRVGAGDFGWEEWTGTVKLSHYFSDALNAYVTLDRGFRPGAPNFDTTGVFQPDLTFYEGETVDSIEIGAKGDLFDGRARYTAAIFYSVYEDYQVPAVNLEAWNLITNSSEIPSSAPFVNVDEAVQRGVEADFRMLVTDQWMVYGAFTYTNVEFTDGVVPCIDPSLPPVSPTNRFNTCDADGEVASAQPEWTATFQSEYHWPDAVLDSEAYVSGLVAYRGDGESPGDTTGRLETDSFATLDLFAGLRNEMWSAQLFVKNAFDDD
ncbi:MAG: TonB-dependent receptor, partial [Halioglobus sp.]|nr:TonB-dependent receptor [Halioglobus sp.]